MADHLGASCVFCQIIRGELTPDVRSFLDANTAVFPSLHQQPRNRGHMLVVPVRHIPYIYEIDADLAGPLMTTVARVAMAVKLVWGAHGVSVRQNNERHGGQDVLHVHFHVVPRFADDGFNDGDRRFPYGATEVPLEERVEQAAMLSEALVQVPGDGETRPLPDRQLSFQNGFGVTRLLPTDHPDRKIPGLCE